MKGKCFIACLLLGIFSSCEGIFQFHPNQIILEEDEKNLTEKNLVKIRKQSPEDTLRLLVMGDTQRFYDQAEDFVKVANSYENIDFVIHLGDISDFGMSQEFLWVHDILKKLKWPYLTVVGNHDLIANGKKVYQQVYGNLNYSFVYGETKFIFIDSNSREYNFNGKVPDINNLKSELTRNTEESWNQAVIVSHIPPFDSDFDKSLEMEYHNVLSESGLVGLSLHGHKHSWTTEKKYDGNITYHVTTTVKKRGFSLIKIWKGGFEIEKVFY